MGQMIISEPRADFGEMLIAVTNGDGARPKSALDFSNGYAPRARAEGTARLDA